MTLSSQGLHSDENNQMTYYAFTGRGLDQAHHKAPPSTVKDLKSCTVCQRSGSFSRIETFNFKGVVFRRFLKRFI